MEPSSNWVSRLLACALHTKKISKNKKQSPMSDCGWVKQSSWPNRTFVYTDSPPVKFSRGEPNGLPSSNLPNDQPDARDFNHPQMVVVCAGDVEKTTRAKQRWTFQKVKYCRFLIAVMHVSQATQWRSCWNSIYSFVFFSQARYHEHDPTCRQNHPGCHENHTMCFQSQRFSKNVLWVSVSTSISHKGL